MRPVEVTLAHMAPGQIRQIRATEHSCKSPDRLPTHQVRRLDPPRLCCYLFPLRLTFFEKSVNAFPRVFCLHQFVEINLLGSSKTFVEVHAIPSVDSLFRCSEGGGTQLGFLFKKVFTPPVDLSLRDSPIPQA